MLVIIQRSKQSAQICLRRYVHNDASQSLAVFNRILNRLIDISNFKIGTQIVYIFFEKRPQPHHITPIVEQFEKLIIFLPSRRTDHSFLLPVILSNVISFLFLILQRYEKESKLSTYKLTVLVN